VRIEDDGPGIAPEVLPHIFEPYYTTKAEGSGLGLATSQAIVQEHGGLLSVATHPGVGATFEVLLPPSREVGEADAPTRPSPIPVPAASTRILVMDDQVGIQSLLQRGLERAGYSVVVTSNGEQALLEFERERARGRAFDLAILDLTVRGGMGGVEALARLREVEPRVLAIATTGYSEETLGEDLRASGFARVLPKPFLMHELVGTITAVLAPA
jgi:CheY-like chemotaxis protein